MNSIINEILKSNELNYNTKIKAAKIDSSDSCLWFDMGDSAMKLGKYMIARHAFEECFRLNSTYWECLDNLIVLLYSLGSYRRNLIRNITLLLKIGYLKYFI